MIACRRCQSQWMYSLDDGLYYGVWKHQNLREALILGHFMPKTEPFLLLILLEEINLSSSHDTFQAKHP